VVPAVGGFLIIAISIIVILLLCIVCKRKRKLLFQNKAADDVYHVNEPDVWSEIERIDHPDPFAQNSGPDVEHNDTVEALYDTINDHNFPFISRVKKSYTVTRPSNPVQESTLDKTEEEYMSPEYNIPKVAEQGSSVQPKLSSDLAQKTASDQKDTQAASRYKELSQQTLITPNIYHSAHSEPGAQSELPQETASHQRDPNAASRYEELDHQNLATPNVYQSALTKEVDSNYDLPLILGPLLLPKVEKSKVPGMPKEKDNMDEVIKKDIDTQELISDIDDVATQNEGVDSEQMVATDEEYVEIQNSTADDEEQEVDNQSITSETVNLLSGE
jgi:hypothetical protein